MFTAAKYDLKQTPNATASLLSQKPKFPLCNFQEMWKNKNNKSLDNFIGFSTFETQVQYRTDDCINFLTGY